MAETVYGGVDDGHTVMCERVQTLARSIYREFETMISQYGDGVIKDLMPLVVSILENLNQAFKEKQEQDIELELIRVENDNLKVQFEKEKIARKAMEQKYLEIEDNADDEKKQNNQRIEALESRFRRLEVKLKNSQEQISRHEDKESEMKNEYNKLHSRYTELIKSHAEQASRYKVQSPQDTTSRIPSQTVSLRQVAMTSSCKESSRKSSVEKEDFDIKAFQTSKEVTTNKDEDFTNCKTSTNHRISTNDDDTAENLSAIGDCRNSESQDSVVDSSVVTSTDAAVVSGASEPEMPSTDDSSAVVTSSSGPDADIATGVVEVHNSDAECSIVNNALHHTDEVDTVNEKEENVQIENTEPTSEENSCPADTSEVWSNQELQEMRVDALYGECLSATYSAGNSMVIESTEFDYDCLSEDSKETEMLSMPTVHNSTSVYEELVAHDIGILGEVDAYGADLTGVGAEVEKLIAENAELLATKNALNIVKDDLIADVDELNGEVELLREELSSVQTTRDKQDNRIAELEEELKKLREELDTVKSKQAEDDEENGQKKCFSRVDMARVIMERNQFKEKLMDLQEAVRRAEIVRASKAHPELIQETKKKNSSWNFFSGLFDRDRDSTPSKPPQKKNSSTVV